MFVIDQARPDEWATALELAYQHLPDEERRLHVIRMLHWLELGTVDPRGIWVARLGGFLAGVQVVIPLGGADYLFWMPTVGATEPQGEPRTDLEDELVQAALDWCSQAGGKLAQAPVAPADAERAVALERNGFTYMTQMLYLDHDLNDIPEPEAPARACSLEPISETNEAAFREALARSYEETLDCPELNGVRTIDEVLAGYRSAGPFSAERWLLIRAGDAPAGVVVVTALPESATWELSYLGIVPEHRRRGFARAAVCHALSAARDAGAAQVIVAVDSRNAPALHLYRTLRFVEGDARDVYLFLFPGCKPLPGLR
jgi:mycothiol synthase